MLSGSVVCVQSRAAPVGRGSRAREPRSTEMSRLWMLSALLAGSSQVLLSLGAAVTAAKMPPKPAALRRPAFSLSQEKPEQPPKEATDPCLVLIAILELNYCSGHGGYLVRHDALAPAAVKVGRLRGGDSPDADRVGTACTQIARPATLLLMTAVYYLLHATTRPVLGVHASGSSALLDVVSAIMHFLIVVEWFFVAFFSDFAAAGAGALARPKPIIQTYKTT